MNAQIIWRWWPISRCFPFLPNSAYNHPSRSAEKSVYEAKKRLACSRRFCSSRADNRGRWCFWSGGSGLRTEPLLCGWLAFQLAHLSSRNRILLAVDVLCLPRKRPLFFLSESRSCFSFSKHCFKKLSFGNSLRSLFKISLGFSDHE